MAITIFVVVTRQQSTSEKLIYIDGTLDAGPQFATLDPLSDPQLVAVGCAIDASQSSPATANPVQYFSRYYLDDMQRDAGVLNSSLCFQSVGQLPARRRADNGGLLVARYDFEIA